MLVIWSLYWSFDLNGYCYYQIVFPPTVPFVEGGASAIMQVHEYWLCLPASHVRPFVQTVRVRPSDPHCCWCPCVLPSVPKPPCVPATLPRASHSAVPPPSPSSTAPPSASQEPCSTDPKLCLSPPTADGRQEKNTQSGLVSLGGLFDCWD